MVKRINIAPLVALRYRDYRLLWIGQINSVTGSQMQSATLNWHIYQLTHEPIYLGLLGLVRVIPIIIFSLVGGVVADAIDRKRLMVVTQSAMALCAAILATADFQWHHYSVAHLLSGCSRGICRGV